MAFNGKQNISKQAAVQPAGFLATLRGLLVVAVFLSAYSYGYAAESNPEQIYTTDKATIVFSVTDGNEVVITDGRITATGGQSIRLLPGTHIKKGAQIKVNIADKECQDAIAEEVAKEQEAAMLATVAERQKEALIPMPACETTVFSGSGPLPEQETALGQQGYNPAALTVNPTVSFSAPSTTVNSKNSILDIHNLMVMALDGLYTPSFSWGELAGTIKVLRC